MYIKVWRSEIVGRGTVNHDAAAEAYGRMIRGRHAVRIHDGTACLYANPSKAEKAPFPR